VANRPIVLAVAAERSRSVGAAGLEAARASGQPSPTARQPGGSCAKQASRASGPKAGASGAATAVELRRYRYDPITQSYQLELGPVAVAPGDMEAFVLAQDTTGVLWGAFTQDNQVQVVHTRSSDADWSAPVPLPAPGAAVSSDDTAALVAFGGKIGVLWSNQCPRYAGCPRGVVDQTFHFAWHADGEPDDAWTGETAYAPGGNAANDHVNLKADASGRVYAAVKTSFTKPAEPLVVLLVRDPDGAWRASPVSTVADDQTRPIVVVDDERAEVSVFATAPLMGGAIYGKRASLSELVFPPGRGTPVLQSAADARITNVTATKQPVDARSGIVLLAADERSRRDRRRDRRPPARAVAGRPAARHRRPVRGSRRL
jgi:hypothetical protein